LDSRARSFAEEAIRAVGRGDAAAARTFISQAFDADHKIGQLADSIYLACSEIETEGGVSIATWNTLADSVDSAELLAVVEGSRI
jgi:hypothetical protein